MTKNRREFLKLSTIAGAASILPFESLKAAEPSPSQINDCVLIPSETAGPFPLDLTENTTFFRQDIRETEAGVQLNLRLKIIGSSNCEPMQNVRVNIWHCTREGVYSGYNTAQNPGDANSTFLRGYQYTDANGEVEFITIFPGWYMGRICHIHFQVYVSSNYSAISQLTFPIETKNAIYAANTSLYPDCADPLNYNTDNIFSDGYALQLATLTPNSSTGGYDSYLEVTVQGSGSVGLGHIEKQNARNFTLGQNFPNPYINKTTVPFTLVQGGDTTLALFDLQGRKVYSKNLGQLATGAHQIDLNMETLGLPIVGYIYQLEVKNSNGKFVDSKMMTAMK